MNKIFLAGIIFLVLLGAANASNVTGNFSVSCDCLVPGQAVFSLQNTSSSAQTFKISSTAENKDWINLNGKWIGKETLELTLNAGETKNLYAFIKPQSCYVNPGAYSITLQFQGQTENFSKTISVSVLPSRTLSIDVNAGSLELSQCQQKNILMTITNTGKSDDLIAVSIKGIPSGWVEYSQTGFLLEKNHSKQMSLLIKPDCAAKAKEYPFSIVASIQNTNFSTEKSLSLKIIDAQEIIISSGALNACSDKETTAQIKIKNTGKLSDSLELSATGLSWVSISPLALSLNAGEEKTVSVTFKKTTDAATKDYDFLLVAHSKTFNKDTEKEFSVSLQDCYGITISGTKINGSETSKEACIENQLVYEFEISNDKTQEISIDAGIRGIEALISPSTIKIFPGQKQTFKATFDISKQTPGDKNFALVLKSEFFSKTQSFPSGQLTVMRCRLIMTA